MIVDELDARIADLASRISFIEKETEGRLAILVAQKAELEKAKTLLTPQIEAAWAQLRRMGII